MLVAALLDPGWLPVALCLSGLGLLGAALHAALPPPGEAELEAGLSAGLAV